MPEVKTHLFHLVGAIETGAENEAAIARKGRSLGSPACKAAQRPRLLGVARGQWTLPVSIDGANPEIAALFERG